MFTHALFVISLLHASSWSDQGIHFTCTCVLLLVLHSAVRCPAAAASSPHTSCVNNPSHYFFRVKLDEFFTGLLPHTCALWKTGCSHVYRMWLRVWVQVAQRLSALITFYVPVCLEQLTIWTRRATSRDGRLTTNDGWLGKCPTITCSQATRNTSHSSLKTNTLFSWYRKWVITIL
jgi:hypothetical protein